MSVFQAVCFLGYDVSHVRNNPIFQVTAEDLIYSQLMFKEKKKTCQGDEMCLQLFPTASDLAECVLDLVAL